MATTAANVYSKIVNGKMLARKRLLDKFNSAFDVDFGAAAGAVVVQMWDTWSTATPAAGTLATHKAANQLFSLTLTSTETTMALLPHQRQASFARPEALLTGATQAADALLSDMQAQAIASLKASTNGLSISLPTGYIDFVIPSAATDPDMVNNVVASVQRGLEYVRANTDADDSDLAIITTPNAAGRFKAAARRSELAAWLEKLPGGRYSFDGVEIFPVSNGASFGGASNEVMFILHKRGFALKFSEPYVHGGGWVPGPDVVDRWTLVAPYAYGVTETEFIAEIVNPAT